MPLLPAGAGSGNLVARWLVLVVAGDDCLMMMMRGEEEGRPKQGIISRTK